MALERTIFTGRKSQPYIPGSSFKGAIRTAILDVLNAKNKPTREDNVQRGTTQLEKRLLKGDFGTSPLRLLKIADLMPTQDQDVARRVMFAVNRKKREVRSKDGLIQQPKGIAARKECILHGQYRAFVADAAILPPTNLRAIAKNSNTYHQQRLHRELSVLDGRGLVNPDWKKKIESLLTVLKTKLDSGDAFLIRIGRYGGADNKTLTGEGVASIKIMGARVDGKQQFTFESATKTVWLAAETENEQKHLLPFGWAVVEIDPQEDLLELRNWCDAESKNRPNIAALRQMVTQKPEPIVWPSARIQFNVKNGTLIAEYKGETKYATAPKGEVLLKTLPPATQAKIKHNEFVKAQVTIFNSIIIQVEIL